MPALFEDIQNFLSIMFDTSWKLRNHAGHVGLANYSGWGTGVKMGKVLLMVLVILLPLTVGAQQVKSTPPLQQASALLHMPSEQVVTLGIGIIAGAIGLHALLGGAAWTLAGAVAGGLVADWWYVQRSSPRGHHGLAPASAIAAR